MIESTARQQIHQIVDSLSLDMLTELLQVIKQFLQRKEKEEKRYLTVEELRNSEFIGLWKDRTDITDNLAYARQLREKAQKRSHINHDYLSITFAR